MISERCGPIFAAGGHGFVFNFSSLAALPCRTAPSTISLPRWKVRFWSASLRKTAVNQGHSRIVEFVSCPGLSQVCAGGAFGSCTPRTGEVRGSIPLWSTPLSSALSARLLPILRF